MPLTRNQKIAAAAVAGLAVLGFAAAAKADDGTDDGGGDDPEPCPFGFHRVPTVNGGSVCVPDIVVPSDDGGGGDVPFPPLPNVCNYSGCGQPFDTTHSHPSVYAIRFQELGYPMPVPAISANGSMIAVDPARSSIREFQRDFNAVKASNAINGPAALAGVAATSALANLKASPNLSTDGLNGNNTIKAVTLAQALRNTVGLSWEAIVNLVG
jgi:hypothetical protein